MLRVIQWDGDATDWDRLVAADPDGTFDHLIAWREVMSAGLGHTPRYLAAVDDHAALVGVLPLVQVRSLLFGHYLVSMPFLNAGGALGTPAARAALVAHAVAEAEGSGADLLELRTPGVPQEGLLVSERKLTHELALPTDERTLWDALPSKVRSQIRRPMKDGLTVETGSGQVGPFYEVFARHMRTLGTPVLPRAWFEQIVERLPDELVVAVIYAGTDPVAGGLGFCWRGICEITWASARREWSRSAPNMLLYWSFLQQAIARGAHTFDFGRCTPGSATHAFKRQWGGTDRPLRWSQWRRGKVAATPSPDRPLFRLATACWRRLPLALTNTLGPHLARALP